MRFESKKCRVRRIRRPLLLKVAFHSHIGVLLHSICDILAQYTLLIFSKSVIFCSHSFWCPTEFCLFSSFGECIFVGRQFYRFQIQIALEPGWYLLLCIGTCIKTVHNTVCRQDEERVLCKVLGTSKKTSNLQRSTKSTLILYALYQINYCTI